MQDRLKEIEGTLARTKERKNTILYKLYKRRQQEERLARLGVQKLPTNPFEVEDISVVKYVLFTLKQEIGDKIARLRDANLLSIEKDGEAVIRAKNDEVNKLVSRKSQWDARFAALEGKEAPPRSRRKLFFGCAKGLPEAEASLKRPRTSEDAQEEASSLGSSSDLEEDADVSQPPTEDVETRDYDYLERVHWLGSAKADDELLRAEREAEAKAREKLDSAASHVKATSFILSYCKDGAAAIPDEEHFKKQLIDARKRALQERLQALKEKK